MSNIHEQIYKNFCEAEPATSKHICKYKPWGSKAIVIWLDNGTAYKIKDTGGKFIKQRVSEDDIRKKYGL